MTRDREPTMDGEQLEPKGADMAEDVKVSPALEGMLGARELVHAHTTRCGQTFGLKHSEFCDALTSALEARDTAWSLRLRAVERERDALLRERREDDAIFERDTKRLNGLRAALDVARRGLRSIAGEHGNRNGVDWCGICAHPDCVAHRYLEDVDRVLAAPSRPAAPAPPGTPVDEQLNWELCRHDVRKSNCIPCNVQGRATSPGTVKP